jgi:hypothetical protein
MNMAGDANNFDIGPDDDLQAYLRTTCCTCGGAWEVLREEQDIEAAPDLEKLAKLVTIRCQDCGTQQVHRLRTTGTAEKAWLTESRDSDDEPERESRMQHYLFAHVELPRIFFSDAEAYIELLSNADGMDRLHRLWNHTAQEAASHGQEMPLPVDGLGVTQAKFGGQRAVVIEMPLTARRAEAHFAALLEGSVCDGLEPRYLVLERTDPHRAGEPRAVLCEWMADGSRSNHGRHITPGPDVFRTLVSDFLRRETERRAAGVRSSAAESWNPRLQETPPANLFAGGFRAHLCIFAFEVLPKAITEGRIVAKLRLDVTAHANLSELWERAGMISRERGHPRLSLPPELTAEWIPSPTPGFVLIHLPQPLSPPEPHLVLIPTRTPARASLDRFRRAFSRTSLGEVQNEVYTLELASADPEDPAILAKVDAAGNHAILGSIDGSDRASVFRAVSEYEAGRSPDLESSAPVLNQLMLYAMSSRHQA